MSVASLLAWDAAHDGREPEHGWNIDAFWEWYRQIYGVSYEGAAWCGTAVCVSLTWGGGWKPPSNWISVAAIEDWGKVRGRWHWGTAGVRPGDVLVLFGRGIHTEVCRRAPVAGFIRTYGGNTSSGNTGSQDNGDGFYSRTRMVGAVRGYVRLHDVLDKHLQPKVIPGTTGEHFHLGRLPLDTDGDFGPQTIGQVEHRTGAPVDGVFARTAKVKLQAYLNAKLSRLQRIRYGTLRLDGTIGAQTVKALQRRLAWIGFYKGRVDGVWGEMTTRALQTAINHGKF